MEHDYFDIDRFIFQDRYRYRYSEDSPKFWPLLPIFWRMDYQNFGEWITKNLANDD